MQFCFQIPIPHLTERWGELDFALAHLVNASESYKSYYYNRPKDRTCILDNSLHELGQPLPIDAISNAANEINADYIIPPDWHGERERTLRAAEVAVEMFGLHRVAPVIQGKTYDEFKQCYTTYRLAGFNIICIPYRMRELRATLALDELYKHPHIKHHFLGLNGTPELYVLAAAPNATLDTGKPFREAQYVGQTHPLPKLDMYRNCKDLEVARNYIAEMRRIVNGRNGS